MKTDEANAITATANAADIDNGTDFGNDARPTSPESRRGAHPFDSISAVFGILTCLAGVFVMTGTIDPFATDEAGVWIAAAVAAIGVAMLPWRHRRTPPNP